MVSHPPKPGFNAFVSLVHLGLSAVLDIANVRMRKYEFWQSEYSNIWNMRIIIFIRGIFLRSYHFKPYFLKNFFLLV